jgi:hypothetical protein
MFWPTYVSKLLSHTMPPPISVKRMGRRQLSDSFMALDSEIFLLPVSCHQWAPGSGRQEPTTFEVKLPGCRHSILVYASRVPPNTALVNVTRHVSRTTTAVV